MKMNCEILAILHEAEKKITEIRGIPTLLSVANRFNTTGADAAEIFEASLVAVCEGFNINRDDFWDNRFCNAAKFAQPKQAHALMLRRLGVSYNFSAKMYGGGDHTTMRSRKMRAEDLLIVDHRFRQRYDASAKAMGKEGAA